jgi:hypothetical protein
MSSVYYLDTNNKTAQNFAEVPNDIFIPLNTNRTEPRKTSGPQGRFTAQLKNYSVSLNAFLSNWINNNPAAAVTYPLTGAFEVDATSVEIDSANDVVLNPSGNLQILLAAIPTYADDTAAGVGGLTAGQVYKTAVGALMIKL